MFGMNGSKNEKKDVKKAGTQNDNDIDGAKNSEGGTSAATSAGQTSSGSPSTEQTLPSSSSSSLRGKDSYNSTDVSKSVVAVNGSDGAITSSHDGSSSSGSGSSNSSSSKDDENIKFRFETDDSQTNDSIFDTGLYYQHKTYDTKLEKLHPKYIDREIIKKVTPFFEYDEKNKTFFSSTLTGNYSAEVLDKDTMHELTSLNLSEPVILNKRIHKEDGSFSVVPTLTRREPSIPNQFQGAAAPPEWNHGHKSKVVYGNHSHIHGFNASHHGHHGHHGQHSHSSHEMSVELPITGMTSDGKPIRGGSTVRPSAHASHESYEKHVADQLMNLEAGESKVVFVGDSCLSQITRDETVRNALIKYHPLNLASPGFRTEHMMYRLSTSKLHKVHSASLFVVMIGTFNVGISNTPEAIRDGIIAVVQKILGFASANSRVVVCSILPRASLSMNRAIEKTNELVRSSIRSIDRVHYLHLDPLFKGAPYPLKILNEPMYMPDHLHPSEKGYMKLVTLLRPYIADVGGTPDPPASSSAPPLNSSNTDTSIPEGESGEVVYRQADTSPASSNNTKDDGKIVNEEELERKESAARKPDFYNEKAQKSEAASSLEKTSSTSSNVAHQPKKLDVNESDDAKWQEAETKNKKEDGGQNLGESEDEKKSVKEEVRKEISADQGNAVVSNPPVLTPTTPSANADNNTTSNTKDENTTSSVQQTTAVSSPSTDVAPLESTNPRDGTVPPTILNNSMAQTSSLKPTITTTETPLRPSNNGSTVYSSSNGGNVSSASTATNIVKQASLDLTIVNAVPPAPSAELGEEPGFEPHVEQPAAVIAHYSASETEGPPDQDEDVVQSADEEDTQSDDSSSKKSKKSSKKKKSSKSKSKNSSKKNKSKSKKSDDDDKGDDDKK